MRLRLPLRPRSAVLLAASALLASTLTHVSSPPAAASSSVSHQKGFDACQAPSAAQMRTWWDNSPYWNIGIYLGGSMRACAQPNLTADWLDQVGPDGIGWHFLPTWVGPQAPCTGYTKRFSYNASTAYQQGRDEAIAAWETALDLGMDTEGMPVIYDLEGFDTTDTSCVNAAKQFVQGWTDQLHVAPAQQSGVYGSSCSSSLQSFASLARPPEFIWGATWDGNPSTTAMACVSSGSWSREQRHKQYIGDHDETWGGLTVNIDTNCSNGPVYPAPAVDGGDQGCGGASAARTSTAAADEPAQAELVTSDFGWALTGDRLRVTDDGGATFRDARRASGIRTAHFTDARRGWVAAAKPGSVTVSRTVDGGRTWRTKTLPVSEEISRLELAIGADGRGGLLAQNATGVNFSEAVFYATENGGASWQRRGAPAAGAVEIGRDGAVRLAGGADGKSTYVSRDLGRHWDVADSTVRGAAGTPSDGVQPVTVSGPQGRPEVVLMSGDGLRELSRLRLGGSLGPGMAAPVAAVPRGFVVAEADGRRLHRVTAEGAVSSFSARGLDGDVTSLSFADGRTGWALTATGGCDGGKDRCTASGALLRTTDGGRNWRPVSVG